MYAVYNFLLSIFIILMGIFSSDLPFNSTPKAIYGLSILLGFCMMNLNYTFPKFFENRKNSP